MSHSPLEIDTASKAQTKASVPFQALSVSIERLQGHNKELSSIHERLQDIHERAYGYRHAGVPIPDQQSVETPDGAVPVIAESISGTGRIIEQIDSILSSLAEVF